MRILFTSHAMPSHLRLLLPVALAASQAGHTVAIAAPEAAAGFVTSYGLGHLAAGRNWLEARSGQQPALGSLSGGLSSYEMRASAEAVTDMMTGEPALCTARDVIALAAGWRPDLVVRGSTEFGGYLAAEVLGVPHASVTVSGRTGGIFSPSRLAPVINAHRRALGLAPDPTGKRAYRFLHACLTPRSFDPAEGVIPNTRFYGHIPARLPRERLPGWLARVPTDRPLIYASLGTILPFAAASGPAVLRDLVAALGKLECHAIISTQGTLDPAENPHPHVSLVDHIPQSLLLEACDLFVTHGGYNSVLEALRTGVPMVAVPFFGDGTHNAARCAARGVARVLPADDIGVEPLLAACQQVLGDPSYAQRVRAVQRQLLTLPSAGDLAADLAGLAS